MDYFAQQLINGIVLGSIYGLIAIGYTMVYGIVGMINFAHGEIFMIGGFGALTTYLALPSGTSLMVVIPLMIIGGAIASVAVATAAERFAYRPLRGAPRLAPLITAIGLSIVLQQLVWGFYPEAKKPRSFPEFQGESFKILDNLYLQRADAFILVLAPLCMLALGLFVAKSRSGRAMQATAQDPDTAKLMGINTDRIIVMAFAIGAAFAAIAAVAYGLDKGQINFEMGFLLGLKAFTAAVLGGIGNVWGAVVGGLTLGVVEAMAVQFIPGTFGGSPWKDVWAFALLIIVLVFRPQGILGAKVVDRA